MPLLPKTIRRKGLVLLSVLFTTGALAAGGSGGELSPAAPNIAKEMKAAQQAIDQQDWATAITQLEKARSIDGRNADVYNLLGYSLRKSGKPDQAIARYQTALRLDPVHLGAHEYIGEAYLALKQPTKARTHLAELARLCGEGCEQYQDLAKALAAYDAAAPSAQSSSR